MKAIKKNEKIKTMKTKMNKKIKLGIFLLVGILLMISFISSSYMRSNVQYTQFNLKESVEKFDKSVCEAGQDFIIQIAPFGCTPVVRSDLLEEQNVPVYCQLMATKINPLIDVEAIESISFSEKEYSREFVSDVGFHPARAALGVEENLNFPVLNNIGYVVILLKKQKNASAMPNFVEGNLTAKIKYDIKNAFGIGKASFYLPEFSDEDWEAKYVQYGFWSGKWFLRAENIESDRAVVSIYDSTLRKISSVSLKEGEISEKIYLPGFDCLAGLELKLDSLESPDTRAKLRINDDIVEVAKGEKFLENKCEVKSLEKKGLAQKVIIKCKDEKSFELKIEPKINLSIDGVEKEYEVGDWLYKIADEEKSVYLGYVGTYEDTEKKEDLYVYFVEKPKQKDSLSEDEISDAGSLAKLLTYDRTTGIGVVDLGATVIKAYAGLANLAYKFVAEKKRFYYLPYQYISDTGKIIITSSRDVFESQVEILGFAGSQNEELDGEEYYENAMENYETIMESFSSVDYFENEEITSGEEALYKKIILALDIGQKRIVVELCEEFKEKYPNSGKNLKEYCDDEYKLSSSEIASRSVMSKGKLRKISFEGIYEPSLDDYSVRIFIKGDGENYTSLKTLQKNQKISVSETEFISLKELGEDYAVFDVSGVEGLKEELLSSNLKINLRDYEIVGKNDYQIRVDKINLKKFARVSVIPNIDNVGTEASFGFKIGIEKRSIELSPEKTKKIIKDLNKTIEEWTKISEGFGSLVKGLKTACLGVGTMLTVKNFFANTGGKAIARQHVMRDEGGWYERCADAVSTGRIGDREVNYKTINECFTKEANNIDNDVDEYYSALTKQNEEIKELQEGYETSKFLTETYVNTKEFGEEYIPIVKDELEETLEGGREIDVGGGEMVEVSKILEMITPDKVSTEQARSLQLNNRIDSNMTREQLDEGLVEIYINAKDEVKRQTLADEFGIEEIDFGSSKKLKEVKFSKDITFEQVEDKFSGDLLEIDKDSFVRIFIDKATGKEYLIQLDNEYHVNQTYLIGSGNSLQVAKIGDRNLLDLDYKKYDRTSYQNPYTSSLSDPKKPVLRYYETEPYKGLPAIVPFDLDNGWYAFISQTLPIGGNIKAYSDSGRVESLYVCNVWENGREENRGGDDKCTMINLGTGQPYDEISGLTDSQARKIVGCAIDAVKQASRAYKSRRVQISTSCDTFYIDVGKPAVDIPDMQCQDFMSPKDCNLLFNVCDPVICPSSRCDFGGAYPVKDVIQSGIIGSIALCLPNFPEIKIPVCLTGIKAGIDGLLSVYTSYRDCLQNSLDTGEMVGICDEIYSIHLCEFFWRQTLPLAKIAIPKMMEWVLGQNVRGGGEYLGVASAWVNADKSVNYFTQYYAASSYKAFKARTTEEIGGEFCKMYVSAVYPEGGNLLDSLIEPDSPPQFHGRFDEIPFTSVTVPPISHYKVFYHIFAGKDSGAYYKVYLKGVPESSYYQDTATRLIVDSGYISTGGYVSETKDFTAPSGYKEMCIMVNNQEECGFKQVSTSFAVNYVKDEYIASQVEKTDIKTETECIAGSASAYSLLTPSPQGAAEEIINPAIYNRGIIRICATDNPGKGTDAYAGGEGSRWVEVGYCDNRNIKCWLDTESVEDVIEFKDIEEDVLEEVSKNQLEILRNKEGYLSEEEFKNVVDEAEGLIKDSKFEDAIEKVDDYFNKVFLNSEKVNLLFLRGNAYAELARLAVDVEKEEATTVADKDVGDEEENEEDAEGEGEEEEKVSWTTASALVKVVTLDGEYSDNRIFVDQLCEDSVLTNDECDDIRGKGIEREKDMRYLERILKDKQEAS